MGSGLPWCAFYREPRRSRPTSCDGQCNGIWYRQRGVAVSGCIPWSSANARGCGVQHLREAFNYYSSQLLIAGKAYTYGLTMSAEQHSCSTCVYSMVYD